MSETGTANEEANGPGLRLSGPPVFLRGKGFGIPQPVVSTRIHLVLPGQIDLAALDHAMREFLPGEEILLPSANDQATAIVLRIQAWQAALQRDANVPVFGEGQSTAVSDTEWALIMPYFRAPASHATLDWLLPAIWNLLLPSAQQTQSIETLRSLYETLRTELGKHALPGTNAFHFVDAAHARKLEVNLIADQIIGFGLGCNSTWLESTITDSTPALATKIAKNKYICARVLNRCGLPTPVHGIPANEDEALSIAQKIGYPVVIKPFDQDGGAGVFAGLPDEGAVREAFASAITVSHNLLVEKHVAGDDFRLTVLHGKVIKVMQRRPGGVTGDGDRTIAALLEEEQCKSTHQAALRRTGKMRISLDEEAMGLLRETGLTPDSVPESGHFVVLRRKSNISTGGSHRLVPIAQVHPDNLALAVSATSAVGLDISGIDVLVTDIGRSWREVGGAICEVNGQPQIGYRDTPEIYDHILSQLLKKQGKLRVHLFIEQPPHNPPPAFLEDVKSKGYNAIALGNQAAIEGAGAIGPFRDSFQAATAVLTDRRTTGAILFMAWQDVIRHGLPAGWFTSIRVILAPDFPPNVAQMIKQMVDLHADRVTFVNSSAPAAAPQPQTGAVAAE